MPDLFKTRTELKERAALLLAVIEPGETLAAEDEQTLDELIDPLLAELSADEIITIQDDEQIENEYFLPLARILANIAGPHFGSPINEAAKAMDERTLRRMSSGKPTFETMKTVYY